MIRKSLPPGEPARPLPAAELVALLYALLDPRRRRRAPHTPKQVTTEQS